MNNKTIQAMRNGGLSRRGFLRAMGVTVCSVALPGIGLASQWRYTRYCTHEFLERAAHGGMFSELVTSDGVQYAKVSHAQDHRDNGLWRVINHYRVTYATNPPVARLVQYGERLYELVEP